MRSTVKILVVIALALGAVALAAVPGGAGGPIGNSLTVVKHVTGPVPAGTTFTVEVTCVSQLGAGAAAPIPDMVITFDATGAPTSDNSLTVSAGKQCTVTETANGTAAAARVPVQHRTRRHRRRPAALPGQLRSRRQPSDLRRRDRRRRHHHRHQLVRHPAGAARHPGGAGGAGGARRSPDSAAPDLG